MFGYGDLGALGELPEGVETLDAGSRAGLAVLCAAGEGLREAVRPGFAGQVADLLSKRLKLESERCDHPQIANERIEAPIIICGLPRSGTSLLHALLAEDAGNRAPRCWELMTPSPPAPSAVERRLRVAKADGAIQELLAAMPEILKVHPYWDEGGEVAVECEDIMQMSFVSPYFPAFFDIPDYERWRLDADHGSAYRLHHAFLQHLQWRAPGRRWALKGVAHVGHLELVAQTYPDACLVWPHRDPVELFASMVTLVAITRRAGEPAELRRIFEEMLEMTARNLEHALAHRFARDGRILHLRFSQVNRDPVGAIRAIYDRLGQPVSQDHETRMAVWLASPENSAGRHGRVLTDLARFGASPDEVRERLSLYYDSGLLGEG